MNTDRKDITFTPEANNKADMRSSRLQSMHRVLSIFAILCGATFITCMKSSFSTSVDNTVICCLFGVSFIVLLRLVDYAIAEQDSFILIRDVAEKEAPIISSTNIEKKYTIANLSVKSSLVAVIISYCTIAAAETLLKECSSFLTDGGALFATLVVCACLLGVTCIYRRIDFVQMTSGRVISFSAARRGYCLELGLASTTIVYLIEFLLKQNV